MVKYELKREESILIVEPAGALEAGDFERLNQEVDPYIAETGELGGLMVYTRSFPGWNDPSAFLSHMRFVGNHLPKIKKAAVVSDSAFSIFPQLASLFAPAKIRHFDYAQKDAAFEWLKGKE
jgi:hypothetical protein